MISTIDPSAFPTLRLLSELAHNNFATLYSERQSFFGIYQMLSYVDKLQGRAIIYLSLGDYGIILKKENNMTRQQAKDLLELFENSSKLTPARLKFIGRILTRPDIKLIKGR